MWDADFIQRNAAKLQRWAREGVPYPRYTCPLCGAEMRDPPHSWNICPHCETQFQE